VYFKNIVILFIAFLFFSACSSKNHIGLKLTQVKGDQDKAFNAFIDNIEDTGFIVSDKHKRINEAYVKKYKKTSLSNLGFFALAQDSKLKPLLEKYPKLGAFSPFNLGLYQKKSENATWYGHLEPSLMLDIVGISDKKDQETFKQLFKPLDQKLAKKLIPNGYKIFKYKTLEKHKMLEVVYSFKKEEKPLEDIIEDFQEKFEKAFEDKEYIIAGFKNFSEIYEKESFAYDAYWVYSLCHFKFSNDIFNDLPEASIFAPCSVYMYIDKDDNKIKIGMIKASNWIKVLNIQDPIMIAKIKAIDKEIKEIFHSLGAN
jgi:uncharacterized protein (DUF302 family)